ncbi:MAG: ABC transporter ATP-binding protein [Desulfovibrio sp.]|jgi:oligopeptide/dipeptide ABC transporter ATP-binding protein|nr:ABC transporter ATP-binding protein [Desulfovibrio sp.]
MHGLTRENAASRPVTCTAGSDKSLLEARDLRIGFARNAYSDELGLAVDGVDFSLERGKTLCLVGESGCGKSVTALSLLRLLPVPPARMLGGSVFFDGLDLAVLPEKELHRIRGGRIGMIFQDPMTSLNPVLRVGEQMGEPLCLHRGMGAGQAFKAAADMLERVGIADGRLRARDFPHQMSGGMRQRVMIGMAMLPNPELLIADEPTTALDVTVQKQILELMRGLLENSGSALLLITHNLGIVEQMADEVAIMYAGRIVEQGSTGAILSAPAHPYTLGLLRSRPKNAERKQRLATIPGTVPSLWERPAGCAFHPRCPKAREKCRRETPPLVPAGPTLCRCWRG